MVGRPRVKNISCNYYTFIYDRRETNSEIQYFQILFYLQSYEIKFNLFSEFCDQRFGSQILLRFILEASINSDFSVHIGSKIDVNQPPNSSSGGDKKTDTAKLFRENLKFGSMPVQPLGSTTVFHSGIIGGGKVPPARGEDAPAVIGCEETAMELRDHISGLLLRLCRASGNEVCVLLFY